MSRALSVLVGLFAITLIALYGFHHRAELAEIFDVLRVVVPIGSHAEAAVDGEWLDLEDPQIR